MLRRIGKKEEHRGQLKGIDEDRFGSIHIDYHFGLEPGGLGRDRVGIDLTVASLIQFSRAAAVKSTPAAARID